MEVPNRPVNFVPAKAGDVLALGPMTLRVMEDGSNTGRRIIYADTRDVQLLTIDTRHASKLC